MVLALSIDTPTIAAQTASKLGLHFPLLSDPLFLLRLFIDEARLLHDIACAEEQHAFAR